jgi:hypothetical protein
VRSAGRPRARARRHSGELRARLDSQPPDDRRALPAQAIQDVGEPALATVQAAVEVAVEATLRRRGRTRPMEGGPLPRVVSPQHAGDVGAGLLRGGLFARAGHGEQREVIIELAGRVLLTPLTVPEVCWRLERLLVRILAPREAVLHWSRWRRWHHAQTRRSHYQRRLGRQVVRRHSLRAAFVCPHSSRYRHGTSPPGLS